MEGGIMRVYPVHYHVVKPERFSRLQLAIRIVAFFALGVLGLSFGMVFLFAYLALPAYAASRLATNREAYLSEDGPAVLRVLHWFAALAAWAGLLTAHLPGRHPDQEVELELDGQACPTATTAVWRVVFGLPSALVFAVLCWIGFFVWVWAALTILFSERVGSGAFNYLEGLQRWCMRLLVYQASLVDEYPPFSFADRSPLPRAEAIAS
jgi:hypothetical protein